ncbi:MAG: hypothetical protein JWP13_271 [Candidatus Saccharibacteria bacterium]|nr:hypothetical protein [Candidatus Saccharibacteria bacterium]
MESILAKNQALLIRGGLAAFAISICAVATVALTQDSIGDSPDPIADPQFSHTGIMTTVFWIGESSDAANGYIPNADSAWDGEWQEHYGGIDSPDARNGYLPADFTPKENPFYVALPYNDFAPDGEPKNSAEECARLAVTPDRSHSQCKNIWVAIRHNDRVAYAQWEDVGPFEEDDTAYVFGKAEPRNTDGLHAGLDVSPAIRDYLGLTGSDNTDWGFVRAADVPSGPWKSIITTSRGYTLQD